jgi:hypothetical protein
MTSPASPPPQLSGSSPPLGWARAGQAALVAFLASRLIVLLGAWIGVQQLVAADPTRTKGLLVEGALMWDATWYWRVVSRGYYLWTPQDGSNLAFCPLYPLILRGLTGALTALGIHVGDPTYGNFVLAGLLVSNLSFIAALVLLWRLIAADHGSAVADCALFLIAVFPTALFWSAIYTESLFLLLVVAVFWFARREQWALAALMAGLAGVTRWVGLLLVVVILLEYLGRRETAGAPWARLRAAVRPGILSLAIVPVPFLLYLWWLQARFGDPLVFLEAEQKGWLHTSTFFPQVWLDYFGLLLQSWGTTTPATDPALGWGGGQRLYLYQDLGFSLLFAALAAWAAWRRSLRPSELAWLALGVIFPLSLGTTIGVARYILPLWPAFLLLARGLAPRPLLERGWLLASAGLLAATTYFWASGHWMD